VTGAGHLCELVRSDWFQARFRVAAKRVEGSATLVAVESGVVAPALPPQSKTRWLQPAIGDGFEGRHDWPGDQRQMP